MPPISKLISHTTTQPVSAYGLFAEARHSFTVVTEPFVHCKTIVATITALLHMGDAELAGLFLYGALFAISASGLAISLATMALQLHARLFQGQKDKDEPETGEL